MAKKLEELTHEELLELACALQAQVESLSKSLSEAEKVSGALLDENKNLSESLSEAEKVSGELLDENKNLSEANKKKETFFSISNKKYKLRVPSFWLKVEGKMTKISEADLLKDKELQKLVLKDTHYFTQI